MQCISRYTFAENLRHHLDRSGYSVTALASRSGLLVEQVYALLQARTRPTTSQAEALARCFDVKSTELCEPRTPEVDPFYC
jgi:transcriptional regulator with XRE-family HTH domain